VAHPQPSFFARIGLAYVAFFRVLFDGLFAGKVLSLTSGAEAEPTPKPAEPPAPKLREAPVDSALQLLGLLQREGRLIDFLQEDVSRYSDAEVGAAARVVHDSVHKALLAHVKLERIRAEHEGSRVTLPKGFSASEVRLTGNVVGDAPFSGTLNHAGWRAASIELPKLSLGHDVSILAPAEVEL
jgi:Domain of unknown function (DUF2760)